MRKLLKVLTSAKRVDSSVNSEYGIVSYEQWCTAEAERIGGGASVKIEKHGEHSFCYITI